MNVSPTRKPFIGAGKAASEDASGKALVPMRHAPAPDPYLTARQGPAEWARRRRETKDARRIEAAGSRAAARVEHLGRSWHVVAWPRVDLIGQAGRAIDSQPHKEQAGFLAIGPGGVFAVTVADHGRARILVAGDVIQISGRRPAYIAQARREARQASKALTRAVGHTVPVVPVLTFVGSGVISVYGLPRDCLVASYQDLDRLLIAGGARISAHTAEKLAVVARHPRTWLPEPLQAQADLYRWYGAGESAA